MPDKDEESAEERQSLQRGEQIQLWAGKRQISHGHARRGAEQMATQTNPRVRTFSQKST